MQIDISVVTYNSQRWLKAFFDSLKNQNYPLQDIKLYFTDNSSTDDTLKELQLLKEKYGKNFADIIISSCPNTGFGNGHNNNIFQGTAKFILVTNVDLVFEAETLSSLVEFAQNDDESVASWEARQKPYEHPKHYNPITLETNWSSSACVLLRRSAIEQIGGYEKEIFMYGEDVDLSYRLRDAGYILKYFPKATVWHYTYEYENQVKPLQFYGSTLANLLLRCRFGTKRDIIQGVMLYATLFGQPAGFPGQRWGVVKNAFVALRKMPHFLLTRKKSKQQFRFLLWDYEMRRDGAFYEYPEEIPSTQPLVSVIMRTYNNRMEFLKEAIQSVANQTYRNIELIVVEDGSSFAKDYVTSISSDTIKKVQYVSIPKGGRCIGGNKGLAVSTGDYCIFLDDDDAFYPEHLEVLLNTINKEHCKAAYTNAFEVKTQIISQKPLEYEEISHSVIYRVPFSRVLMWHQNYIPIQCILFSRKLYEEYGGFDLDLDNLEDWNLWTRYSFKDDFAYTEKTTSIYRVPAEQKAASERQEVLDDYYQKALAKQDKLMMTISVHEFMKMHKAINEETNLIAISKETIKNEIVKHRFLRRFYDLARRVYYKFKR